VYVSWSSSSIYEGDSGNRIFVLYWRCSLIRVSVIRGSTVIGKLLIIIVPPHQLHQPTLFFFYFFILFSLIFCSFILICNAFHSSNQAAKTDVHILWHILPTFCTVALLNTNSMSDGYNISPALLLCLYFRSCAVYNSGLKNRTVVAGTYFLILYFSGINEYKGWKPVVLSVLLCEIAGGKL
jgi:hypothetical protein